MAARHLRACGYVVLARVKETRLHSTRVASRLVTCRWDFSNVCNLYSITSTQQAVRALARAWKDSAGNLPPLPGVFPDYHGPIVRNHAEGRELAIARWGMPSPVFALKGPQQ